MGKNEFDLLIKNVDRLNIEQLTYLKSVLNDKFSNKINYSLLDDEIDFIINITSRKHMLGEND